MNEKIFDHIVDLNNLRAKMEEVGEWVGRVYPTFLFLRREMSSQEGWKVFTASRPFAAMDVVGGRDEGR
jgi:hypothetical protein